MTVWPAIVTVLLACIARLALPAAVLGVQEDSLVDAAEKVRAAKIRDAALRSVDASVEFLEERLSTAEEQALAMLAAPALHRKSAKSRALLRERERERLQAAFREQLASFAADRGAGLSSGWVDDVMEKERERVGNSVERLLKTDFDTQYAKARKSAVRMQRSKLDEDVYPSAAEIEALAGPRNAFLALKPERAAGRVADPPGETLVNEYVAAIAAEYTLFEENEAVLKKRVQRATSDALVLLWRQLRLVDRGRRDGALDRSAITAQLLGDVAQLAREAEQLSGTHYGVFPAAKTLAVERGAALEREAFEAYIRGQLDPSTGCRALSAERVLRDVASSYDTVPAALAAHERQLEQVLVPETERRILDAYTRRLDDPGSRAAFREKLGALLQAEPESRRSFTAAVEGCLRGPLERRRQELASQELAARLPAVADFSFEFTDAALPLAESHSAGDLGSEHFPDPAALRMEETRTAYEQHRQRLHAEAKAAVWRQKLLTRDPDRKSSFVERIQEDADRSEERKAHWQREYETSVFDAWQQVRSRELLKPDSGEPYHPEKYGRVFGPVSEIIEEIITLEFGKTLAASEVEVPAVTDMPTAAPSPRVASAEQLPGEVSEAVEAAGAGSAADNGRVAVAELADATGGAGGGEGCDAVLERCSEASRVCYQALTTCKIKPGSCDAGIARCRTEKEHCELGE
jgi:hypothetical protein